MQRNRFRAGERGSRSVLEGVPAVSRYWAQAGPLTMPERFTEEELLEALLELLRLMGWRAHRIDRNGDGLPDLFATHPGNHRLLVVACESDLGIPTAERLAWLFAFRNHPTIETTIIRPGTYDAAIAWIAGTGPMPEARVLRVQAP